MQTITFNGVTYTVPDPNDTGWGQNLTDFFVAIPLGCLQATGGPFTLAADVDFGSMHGILSKYFETRAVNPASTGLVRMAKTDGLFWRRNSNSGDVGLTISGSDQLLFNGVPISSATGLTSAHIFVGNASNLPADVPMSGDISIDNTGVTTINPGVVTTSKVDPTAAFLVQVPVGAGLDFYGTSAPAHFLLCDGSAVSRTTYAGLFAVIGTTWGAGNGTTTFNVPDSRRRTAVGSGGTGSGELGNTVGSVSSDETVTPTENAHHHAIPHKHTGTSCQNGANVTIPTTSGGGSWPFGTTNVTTTTTAAAGSNQGSSTLAFANTSDTDTANSSDTTATINPANIIQPSMVVTKIIRFE